MACCFLRKLDKIDAVEARSECGRSPMSSVICAPSPGSRGIFDMSGAAMLSASVGPLPVPLPVHVVLAAASCCFSKVLFLISSECCYRCPQMELTSPGDAAVVVAAASVVVTFVAVICSSFGVVCTAGLLSPPTPAAPFFV